MSGTAEAETAKSDKEESTSNSDLLQRLEEKFKYRYTDQDPNYMKVVNKPLPPPPCVYPWFVQNRRPFERRGGYQGGYGRDRNDYRQDSRNRDGGGGGRNWEDRDRGRDYRDRSRDYRDRGRGYEDQSGGGHYRNRDDRDRGGGGGYDDHGRGRGRGYQQRRDY
ncbi:unnamed protein product [Ixodes hexagonus]